MISDAENKLLGVLIIHTSDTEELEELPDEELNRRNQVPETRFSI